MSDDHECHETRTFASASQDVAGIPERFEDAWKHGKPPSIDEYLTISASDPELRRDLLCALVGIDLECRWRSAADGELGSESTLDDDTSSLPWRPRLTDYLVRYPELGPLSELSPDLICQEYYVRRRWGDSPGHDEYLAEFGESHLELRQLLHKVDEELDGQDGGERGVAEGEVWDLEDVDNERGLIECAVSGDDLALQQLLLCTYDRLLRHIQQQTPLNLRETINAEDVLQPTHTQVFRLIRGFSVKSDFTFRNWLTAIADNLLLSAVSAAEQKTTAAQSEPAPGSLAGASSELTTTLNILLQGQEGPGYVANGLKTDEVLKEAIERLPGHLGEVVQLRCNAGLSVEDIGHKLGKSPHEIYEIWTRAKKSLRQILTDSA